MNKHRYDKLNALMYLQQQKSHYKRIAEAKKNIDFSEKTLKNHQTMALTKQQKLKEKQRKQNNIKLVTKIAEINHKNGILQRVEIQAFKEMAEHQYKTKLSKIRRDFQNRTVDGQIMSDNCSIEKRLKSVRPKIGTKGEWDTHYSNFKTYEKKLKKYLQSKEYDPETKLAETLSSFKRSNREQKQYSGKKLDYNFSEEQLDNRGAMSKMKRKKLKRKNFYTEKNLTTDDKEILKHESPLQL